MTIKVGKPSAKLKKDAERIRKYAMSFPETAKLPTDRDIPTSIIDKWIEESFRLIAPKTILKQYDAQRVKPAKSSKTVKPKK